MVLKTFATASLACVIAFVVVAPGAAATGWLVNVEENMFTGLNVELGENIAGGQGDTLDLSLAAQQCSDEDDVVDVSVQSFEGGPTDPQNGECVPSECRNGGIFPALGIAGPLNSRGECGKPCAAEEGKPLVNLPAQLVGDPQAHPADPRCTDDEDAVDASVFGEEGSGFTECQTYRDPRTGEEREQTGDRRDAVDVAVANREWCDDDDGVDVGVINCEWADADDALDVGVLNTEFLRDHGDVLDLSIFNYEEGDGYDHNGLNLGSSIIFDLCYQGLPIGPHGPLA